MKNIFCVSHPLCDHHLTELRERSTRPSDFRAIASRLTSFLALESTSILTTSECPIETPVAGMVGAKVKERIGVFPILRAGLAMVDPMLDVIPDAQVFHLGMYRDEETATPVEYYNKLAEFDPVEIGFILDPMLATGGSIELTISVLKRWGVTRISVLSLISSKEGIERLSKLHPEVRFHTCAIDSVLNSKKYIVPGLGDAGDRLFNTL